MHESPQDFDAELHHLQHGSGNGGMYGSVVPVLVGDSVAPDSDPEVSVGFSVAVAVAADDTVAGPGESGGMKEQPERTTERAPSTGRLRHAGALFND